MRTVSRPARLLLLLLLLALVCGCVCVLVCADDRSAPPQTHDRATAASHSGGTDGDTSRRVATGHHNGSSNRTSTDDDDLPRGVLRGPLLHEHSMQAPFVSDWWEEGVPHFMLGGSAVATERFVRLTSNELDAHGFVFNTAPMDHNDWELRVRVSVRPPPPAWTAAAADNNDTAAHYEGGDGMALWYLQQPIGDDHQHVLKYSKPLSPDMAVELLDAHDPWRMADVLLNDDTDDAVDEFDDVDDDDDLTTAEKAARALARERRELKRRKRHELYRRLFRRGTSVDRSTHEPRIMGVKYSDFGRGFALVLDSVGVDEAGETAATSPHHHDDDHHHHHHHHHRHQPSVYLLLNVPQHDAAANATIVNNFDASHDSFRRAPRLLHCAYNFRQAASRRYAAEAATATANALLDAPEEPVEVVVRYYKRKLSVLLRREAPLRRTLVSRPGHDGDDASTDAQASVVRTYVETLCGELYPVDLPAGYHFGLSASTGHHSAQRRRAQARRRRTHADSAVNTSGGGGGGEGRHHHHDDNDDDDYDTATGVRTHVDVHDVLQMQLRELGKDAKAMGYSKTVPIEHFDYTRDQREREHFSRRIPDAPDEVGPPY